MSAARIRQAREERARAWSTCTTLMAGAEGRSLTAEEEASYAAAEVDIDRLSAEIERLERHELRAAALDVVDRSGDVGGGAPAGGGDTPPPVVDQYRAAFGAYLRGGMEGLEVAQRQLLHTGFAPVEERAQGTASGAAGGFLVPQDFLNKLTETLKFFGGMRQVANRIETTTGATLPWPSADDTGNKGARLAENTAVTEQDVTFASKQLGSFTYTSKMVRVALQLLQDSAFNLDAWLPVKLGERLGRIHNEEFTIGTGVSMPEGAAVGFATGRTGAAGQTTTVTYDDVVLLEHSVNSAYRNSGRAQFMFADAMLSTLRRLKDADGRPLWQPSIQEGVPDRINGRRYAINDDMPVPAASAKSMLFGDFFAGYIIRDVRATQVLRLTERYADFLQVGFLGFNRADGKVDDANAVKAYAHPAA